MDTKVMASFIVANVDLITEFDLKDTYLAAVRERMKADYGVYADKSELSYNLTYEENWKRYYEKNIAKNFEDIEQFKFYQSFSYYGKHIHSIEGEVLHTSGMTVYSLVYILLYVMLNEIDTDLKRANEIETASGLRYDASNYSYTDFGFFQGIKVRKCNNGHITIKGLNDEQKARLQYVYEVCNKRR